MCLINSLILILVDGYLFSSNLWYIKDIIPKSSIPFKLLLEYKLFWKNKVDINKFMIKNFLILNCIGKDNKIGIKVDNNFYIHAFDQKLNNNDQLVVSILNLIKKHKIRLNSNFSLLVYSGPGSFSSIEFL